MPLLAPGPEPAPVRAAACSIIARWKVVALLIASLWAGDLLPGRLAPLWVADPDGSMQSRRRGKSARGGRSCGHRLKKRTSLSVHVKGQRAKLQEGGATPSVDASRTVVADATSSPSCSRRSCERS